MHLEVIKACSGKVYAVMEAAAADLRELVWQQGKLPCVLKARDIFVQVIGAMHYLHNYNLWHQDLEHDDVLLTTGGQT